MAQAYGQPPPPPQQQQQVQPSQTIEYTLPGVLHFLQSEWRRYERDRNEWEIERAEMKARIALLEGERRGIENMKTDLMRRVKMLEYALRQERSKYLATSSASQTQSLITESPTNEDGPKSPITQNNEQALKVTTVGLPVSFSATSQYLTSARDPKNRDKSRELLKACMQEIDYLTNAATSGGLNGTRLPNHLSAPDGNNNLRKAVRTNTSYFGTNSEACSNTSEQRKTTGSISIKKPSRPASAGSLSSGSSSSPPLEHSLSRDGMSEHNDDTLCSASDGQGNNGMNYPEDEQSAPDSPNFDQRNSFSYIAASTPKINGVTTPSSAANEHEYNKDDSTVIYKPKYAGEWKEQFIQARVDNKIGHGKSAEEIKEEEEQLTKDVQKKFNLSDEKVSKLMKNAKSRKSQDTLASNSGSDPQLDELANVNFNVDEDENNQRIENEPQQNASEQKMWRQRFTLRSHLDTVRSTSWNRSELMFVSGSEDGTVKLWDLKGAVSQKPTIIQDIEPLITYRGHNASVNSVVMSSEQAKCYSASMDSTIRVWDLPPSKRETYAPFDPSLNLNTYIGHTDAIWDIRLFPIRNQNTQLLASASADGTVKIWDTEADNSPLKTSWGYYGINTGESVNGQGRPPIPTSIDFVHTDLRKIAVSYQNSIIKLFDIETGQCVVTFKSDETYDKTPATQINRIIAHPTLPLIFSAHEDQYIRFFDINNGEPTFSMLAHLESVTSLDVDPSGMILVSGGHDSSIRLWDIMNTRTCIQEFVSHRRKSDEGVLCVQYHPAQAWLASGGADSVIKIYYRPML